MVRAKMKVSEVTKTNYTNRIRLDAQYDMSIPEDQRFQKATPNGHVEMYIDNPAAVAVLAPDGKPGREFYLDFTPVSAA